jgi:hypothetical protein
MTTQLRAQKCKTSKSISAKIALSKELAEKARGVCSETSSVISNLSQLQREDKSLKAFLAKELYSAPESEGSDIVEQECPGAGEEDLSPSLPHISFPPPLNEDCTVEEATYPFKLVLTAAEERPLETSIPLSVR